MTDATYDRDFYAWTQEQARRLREAKAAGANLPLDFENLAEEVESMGSSERKSAQTDLMRVIEHLLKLEYSPARYPRNGWKKSVRLHRFKIADTLEESESIRAKLDTEKTYRRGRELAIDGLKKDRIAVAGQIPMVCPYTLEQLLDPAWWPANRHGIED